MDMGVAVWTAQHSMRWIVITIQICALCSPPTDGTGNATRTDRETYHTTLGVCVYVCVPSITCSTRTANFPNANTPEATLTGCTSECPRKHTHTAHLVRPITCRAVAALLHIAHIINIITAYVCSNLCQRTVQSIACATTSFELPQRFAIR